MLLNGRRAGDERLGRCRHQRKKLRCSCRTIRRTTPRSRPTWSRRCASDRANSGARMGPVGVPHCRKSSLVMWIEGGVLFTRRRYCQPQSSDLFSRRSSCTTSSTVWHEISRNVTVRLDLPAWLSTYAVSWTVSKLYSIKDMASRVSALFTRKCTNRTLASLLRSQGLPSRG